MIAILEPCNDIYTSCNKACFVWVNLSPSYWYFENMYHCSDPSVSTLFAPVLQYKLRTNNTGPWITSFDGCSLLRPSYRNDYCRRIYKSLNLLVWSHPAKAWNLVRVFTFSLSSTSYNIPILVSHLLSYTTNKFLLKTPWIYWFDHTQQRHEILSVLLLFPYQVLHTTFQY